jgi:hypothetical protein
MPERAASVLSLVAAAAALYAICRELRCGRFASTFGSGAWIFSEAMLRPGVAGYEAPVPSPLLVPFALAGVFSRERRRWPFLALAAACAAFRWRSSQGFAAAELEAMVLAILAALGAQRLWDGEGGPAFLIGAAAAVAMALSRGGGNERVRVVEAAPAAAALLLVAFVSREFRARAGLVALVTLFALQRAAEIGIGGVVRAPVVTAATGPRARPRRAKARTAPAPA